MFKCYYCKIFLFDTSSKVRKQHENGNRHKINVSIYYQKVYINWITKCMI
nr:hypothetical protein 1634Bnrm2_p107 [Cryptomonas sp.]